MTDTDPKLMRRQQDKDTPQTIEPDETRPGQDREDSDAESGAARKAAAAGRAAVPGHADDSVFTENSRSGYSAENEVFEDGRTDAKPPLAKKDRSLLGD